jgi:hypothetical protein
MVDRVPFASSQFKAMAAPSKIDPATATKDPVKSLDNLGHRINTVTVEP